MRAIAAGRIQGAQRALAAARRYQDVVLRGIGALAAASPASSLPAVAGKPPVFLVLTSEQPFCGAFNQNILALAERRLHEQEQVAKPLLVAVGQRGVRQLTARGIVPDISESAATSLPGLRDLVKRLATMLDRLYAAGEIGALHVIYSRYQSVSEQVPSEERILPLDLTRLRPPASAPPREYYRYLPTPALLAGLISEYAFISLYRMVTDSFAGEQASRLLAMDGATRSTERMLDVLLGLERRERQGEITRQVLELIAARFTAE
jgi:F-type H+-transporting ATPase subunit gamma